MTIKKLEKSIAFDKFKKLLAKKDATASKNSQQFDDEWDDTKPDLEYEATKGPSNTPCAPKKPQKQAKQTAILKRKTTKPKIHKDDTVDAAELLKSSLLKRRDSFYNKDEIDSSQDHSDYAELVKARRKRTTKSKRNRKKCNPTNKVVEQKSLPTPKSKSTTKQHAISNQSENAKLDDEAIFTLEYNNGSLQILLLDKKTNQKAVLFENKNIDFANNEEHVFSYKDDSREIKFTISSNSQVAVSSVSGISNLDLKVPNLLLDTNIEVDNLTINADNCELNKIIKAKKDVDLDIKNTLLVNGYVLGKQVKTNNKVTYVSQNGYFAAKDKLKIQADKTHNFGLIKATNLIDLNCKTMTNTGTVFSNGIANLTTNTLDNNHGVIYASEGTNLEIKQQNWLNSGEIVAQYGDLTIRGPEYIKNIGKLEANNLNIATLNQLDNFGEIITQLDLNIDSKIIFNIGKIVSHAGLFKPKCEKFYNIIQEGYELESSISCYDIDLTSIAEFVNSGLIQINNSCELGENLIIKNHASGHFIYNGELKTNTTNRSISITNDGNMVILGIVNIVVDFLKNSGSLVTKSLATINCNTTTNNGEWDATGINCTGTKFENNKTLNSSTNLICNTCQTTNNGQAIVNKKFSTSQGKFKNGKNATLVAREFELINTNECSNLGKIAAGVVNIDHAQSLNIQQDASLLACYYEKQGAEHNSRHEELEKLTSIDELEKYLDLLKTKVRNIKAKVFEYEDDLKELDKKNSRVKTKVNDFIAKLEKSLDDLQDSINRKDSSILGHQLNLRKEFNKCVSLGKRHTPNRDMIRHNRLNLITQLNTNLGSAIRTLRKVDKQPTKPKVSEPKAIKEILEAKAKLGRNNTTLRKIKANQQSTTKPEKTVESIKEQIKYFYKLFDKVVQQYLAAKKVHDRKNKEIVLNAKISQGIKLLQESFEAKQNTANRHFRPRIDISNVQLRSITHIPAAAAKVKSSIAPTPKSMHEMLMHSKPLNNRIKSWLGNSTTELFSKLREKADEHTIADKNHETKSIISQRLRTMQSRVAKQQLEYELAKIKYYKLNCSDEHKQKMKLLDESCQRSNDSVNGLNYFIATIIKIVEDSKQADVAMNINTAAFEQLKQFDIGTGFSKKTKTKPCTNTITTNKAQIDGAVFAKYNSIESNKLFTGERSRILGDNTKLKTSQRVLHKGTVVSNTLTTTGNAELLSHGTMSADNVDVTHSKVNMSQASKLTARTAKISSTTDTLTTSGDIRVINELSLESPTSVSNQGNIASGGLATINSHVVAHSKNSTTTAKTLCQTGRKLYQNGTNEAENIDDKFHEIQYSGTDIAKNLNREAKTITRKKGGKSIAQNSKVDANSLNGVENEQYCEKIEIHTPSMTREQIRAYSKMNSVELYLEQLPVCDANLRIAGDFTLHVPAYNNNPFWLKSIESDGNLYLDLPGRNVYIGGSNDYGKVIVNGNFKHNGWEFILRNGKFIIKGNAELTGNFIFGDTWTQKIYTYTKNLPHNHEVSTSYDYYNGNNSHLFIKNGFNVGGNFRMDGSSGIIGGRFQSYNFDLFASSLTVNDSIIIQRNASIYMSLPFVDHRIVPLDALKNERFVYDFDRKEQTSATSMLHSNGEISIDGNLLLRASTISADENITLKYKPELINYQFGLYEKMVHNRLIARKQGFFKKLFCSTDYDLKQSFEDLNNHTRYIKALISEQHGRLELHGDYSAVSNIVANQILHKNFRKVEHLARKQFEVPADKKQLPTQINLTDYDTRGDTDLYDMAAEFFGGELNNQTQYPTIKFKAYTEVQLLRRALLDNLGLTAICKQKNTEDTYKYLRQNSLDEIKERDADNKNETQNRPKIIYNRSGDPILILPEGFNDEMALGEKDINANEVIFETDKEDSSVKIQSNLKTEYFKSNADSISFEKAQTTDRKGQDITNEDSGNADIGHMDIEAKNKVEIDGNVKAQSANIKGKTADIDITGALKVDGKLETDVNKINVAAKTNKRIVRTNHHGEKLLSQAVSNTGILEIGDNSRVDANKIGIVGGKIEATSGTAEINAKEVELVPLVTEAITETGADCKIKPQFQAPRITTSNSAKIKLEAKAIVGIGAELTGDLDISYTDAFLLKAAVQYYELATDIKKNLFRTKISGGSVPEVLESIIGSKVKLNSEHGKTILHNVKFQGGEPTLNIDMDKLEQETKKYDSNLWSKRSMSPAMQIAAMAVSAWACPALAGAMYAQCGHLAVAIGEAVLSAASQTAITGSRFDKNLVCSLASLGMSSLLSAIPSSAHKLKELQEFACTASKSAFNAAVNEKVHGIKFRDSFLKGLASNIVSDKILSTAKDPSLSHQIAANTTANLAGQLTQANKNGIDLLQLFQSSLNSYASYLGEQSKNDSLAKAELEKLINTLSEHEKTVFSNLNNAEKAKFLALKAEANANGLSIEELITAKREQANERLADILENKINKDELKQAIDLILTPKEQQELDFTPEFINRIFENEIGVPIKDYKTPDGSIPAAAKVNKNADKYRIILNKVVSKLASMLRPCQEVARKFIEDNKLLFKLLEFATTVDCMVEGAAFGSAFAPPFGAIIGAGAGAMFDMAMKKGMEISQLEIQKTMENFLVHSGCDRSESEVVSNITSAIAAAKISKATGKIRNKARNARVDAKRKKAEDIITHYKKEKNLSKQIPHTTANANKALKTKFSALDTAKKEAVKVKKLPDGRVRYYNKIRPAKKNDKTIGSSYVTEYDSKTGRVKSWNESYDRSGKVNRVHPKMINGETVNAPHYPLTGKEVEYINKGKNKVSSKPQ